MAVNYEMLEDEFAPRAIQLLGADGLARWGLGVVGLEAPQDQWAGFQMAAVYVFERHARMVNGQDGQNLCRQTFENQNPQRTFGNHQTASMEISARRQRRFARRLLRSGSQRTESRKSLAGVIGR